MTVPDPLEDGGLASFGRRFREGRITSEVATMAYLERIAALDGRLGAFEHVAHQSALQTARAVDALFAAGVDLGPLMGVPVAVKDIFVVDGMPTWCGSRLDLRDLLGAEGPFIARLRQAGSVILGKTRTVEFALGITGVSSPRGTPVNPCDEEIVRVPGGSSSGSAVAVGAGLCAFAIGSDTGGSARVPAAFCGIFGFKASHGRWPLYGAFPLSRDHDCVGLLAKSAADAALAYSTLAHAPEIVPAAPDTMRLGRLDGYFFDGLPQQMTERLETAFSRMEAFGIGIHPAQLPEAGERVEYFRKLFPTTMLAALGKDRFLSEREKIDPVIARRIQSGLQIPAYEFYALEERRRRSIEAANARLSAYDALLSPTVPVFAPALAEFEDEDRAMALALGISRNSQPANYLDLVALSIPCPAGEGQLPAGLQLFGRKGNDAELLGMAMAVETTLSS